MSISSNSGTGGPVHPGTMTTFHQSSQPCLDHRYAAPGGYFMGGQPPPPKHQHHMPSHQPPPHHHLLHSQQPHRGQPPPPPAGMTYFGPGNGHGPPNNGPFNMFNCYQGVANGWTGVPLISTAKRRPRRAATNGSKPATSIDVKELDTGSAMSKLALHARGVPLILSGSGGNNVNGGCAGGGSGLQGPRHGYMPAGRPMPTMRSRNSNKQPNQNALRVQHPLSAARAVINEGHQQGQQAAVRMPTAIQFVTDENSSNLSSVSCLTSSSSSSASSTTSGVGSADACLPRIIKPRKRRKKERKPGSGSGGSTNADELRDDKEEEEEEDRHDMFSKTSEEDFEDEEELVTDFTTSCSCRLCDPNSHIWSFSSLRHGCEAEDFPDVPPNHHHATLQQSLIKAHKQTQHQQHHQNTRVKDVGVIGGNRLKQQRNEWRGGSPQQNLQLQQQVSKCDNDLFDDVNNNIISDRLGSVINIPNCGSDRFANGGELFGRWPLTGTSEMVRSTLDRSISDDSVDAFPCGPVVPSSVNNNNNLDLCSLGDEEEILIENLANLLNVSPKSDVRYFSETNSDSSGVSSASDCGSVFGECYSPLMKLGSPPPVAFNFTMKAAALPIGPDPTMTSCTNGLLLDESTNSAIAQLLFATEFNRSRDPRFLDVQQQIQEEQEDEEEQQRQQKQLQLQEKHVLSCLDLDWYRAATTNRRLLQPYSNN